MIRWSPPLASHVVRDRLFPDGYCDCRCGPEHHQFTYQEDEAAVLVWCKYHKRECGRVEKAALEAVGGLRP